MKIQNIDQYREAQGIFNKKQNKIKTNPGGEHCKLHIAQYPMGRVPGHTRKGGGFGKCPKENILFQGTCQ